MKLPSFQYLEPISVDEALTMLDTYKETVKVCAGGTEVINHMKLRLIRPAYLMNIKKISDLEGIHKDGQGITIGANTTLKEIAGSPLIKRECKAVAEAAFQTASPTIAAMGTIGGNILQNTRCLYYNQSGMVLNGLEACHKRGGTVCHSVKGSKRCLSVYQGDMAPALIALNASCVIGKKGSTRTIPLAELFTRDGVKPFAVGQGEMLTKVIIPRQEGISGSAYKKLRIRGSVDYPLASAAAWISVTDTFHVTASRIVIGAAGPAPRVVDQAASSLEGKIPEDADFAVAAEMAYDMAEGADNLTLPGAYRRKMVRVLAKRAIHEALASINRGM